MSDCGRSTRLGLPQRPHSHRHLLPIATRPHVCGTEDLSKDLSRPAPTDSDAVWKDLGDRIPACPLLSLILGTNLDNVSDPDFRIG